MKPLEVWRSHTSLPPTVLVRLGPSTRLSSPASLLSGSCQGCEDHSLDPTGEETEHEDRDGNTQRYEAIEDSQSELVSQDVTQQPEAE